MKTTWRRGLRLSVGFLGGLLLCAAPAPAQPAEPSPEQLLAASVHADDLAGINPGGWWDDAPEFNGRLEPDSAPDLVTFVMSHVFGKPDVAPAEVATSLRLYDKAAAAADAFSASADTDKKDYGETVEGPKIGDQSRYLRQAADSEHEGGEALRFRFGRYVARIDVGGDASTMTIDRLAALGKIVADRLGQLDAGKLAAPSLPDLAALLPPADDNFKPVLGTATLASQAWGWAWSTQTSSLIVSARLRQMLHDGVRNESPVMRRYGLATSAAAVAEVAVMPFKTADAADRYLVQATREDARRTAIANKEGDIMVSPPIPDVSPAYRVDLHVGRYVAQVSCFAPFAPTSSACDAVVKELAERVKKKLPEK